MKNEPLLIEKVKEIIKLKTETETFELNFLICY